MEQNQKWLQQQQQHQPEKKEEHLDSDESANFEEEDEEESDAFEDVNISNLIHKDIFACLFSIHNTISLFIIQ